jgi:hypothetical protein
MPASLFSCSFTDAKRTIASLEALGTIEVSNESASDTQQFEEPRLNS